MGNNTSSSQQHIIIGAPHLSKHQEQQQQIIDTQDLLAKIRNNIIGRNSMIQTAFGMRLLTYCDYIASGKPLQFLEDFLQHTVLPFYANTHTEVSFTGKQMMLLREEARAQIMKSCNASAEKDVLIFAGSGSTTCMNRLVSILNLHKTEEQEAIVFVGPYEHHSNILPWREHAKVVFIVEDEIGLICTKDLEQKLIKYSTSDTMGKKRLLLGSFSACSNVSGIVTVNQDQIAQLMHKYGGYVCFDFACGSPYLEMDMNPTSAPDAYKDAIFVSPHKMVGGPETPGVMIIKKNLYHASVPSITGGGTISFVSHKHVVYVDQISEREEGGTPSIIGAIRCGLVFQLKDKVTTKLIHEQESKWWQLSKQRLQKIPNIQILGNTNVERVPILSFLIRHPKHSHLLFHQKFVSNMMNEMFGIQTRASCACAGPYNLVLFGASKQLVENYASLAAEIPHMYEVMKPGFTRLSFNYFVEQDVVEYVLDCIEWICDRGWKLLPLFCPEKSWNYFKHIDTDDYYHHLSELFAPVAPIQELQPEKRSEAYQQYLAQADSILQQFLNCVSTNCVTNTIFEGFEQHHALENVEFDHITIQQRWFPLPSEVLRELLGDTTVYKNSQPVFQFATYPRNAPAPEMYPDTDSIPCSKCKLNK